MKYLSPTDLRIRIQFEDGIPRYSTSISNPKHLHNEPVPHMTHETTFGPEIVACFGNYVCLMTRLQGAYSDDPEERRKAESIYDTMASTVAIRSRDLRQTMDMTICHYYNLGGTVLYLANIFQVGEPRIRGALSRGGLLGVKPARSKAYIEKKSALDEVRDDPRYRFFGKMDINARARAAAAGLECSYQREDILPMINRMRVIPRLCPVLKIAIQYQNSTIPLNAAVIWRKTNNGGLVAGNVAIMSKFASLLIEDPYRSKAQKALIDNPIAAQSWREWCAAREGK